MRPQKATCLLQNPHTWMDTITRSHFVSSYSKDTALSFGPSKSFRNTSLTLVSGLKCHQSA